MLAGIGSVTQSIEGCTCEASIVSLCVDLL
jgi:hypothetical protein